MTHFPEYIDFERNSTWRKACISAFPNRSGIASLENAAFEFEDSNWGKILVITSEFAPRDEVLNWAKELCAKEEYKNHKAIFMTHSYLHEKSGKRIESEGYTITPRNWGEDIWKKLIEPSSNIVLVICGHTGRVGGFEENVAFSTDKNSSGRKVNQMMFNVQTLGGGWEGNGGDGWLRILEFMPDGKTIKVRTYSPLFGISPTTEQFAHRDGKFDKFDIVIE
jgi:hypothetical protein